MSSSFASLTLQQALHGYNEGHRLLASSRPLSRDAQRIMLALSDASGSGMPIGFESYLTAYPLRSDEAFAFARTWAAPEMPRPGCVWTHTLIIGVSELARLSSAAVLCALFRRPSLSAEGYEVPLHAQSGPGISLDQKSTILAPQLIEALYTDNTAKPVVVSAEASEEIESLFLALWDQQWAGQRAAFTFSTGSSSPRVLDSVPFQLQAAPATEARRMSRKLKAVYVETEQARKLTPGILRWVEVAAKSLGDEHSPLHRFICRVGEKLPADRTYFRPLVIAYQDCQTYRGPRLVRTLIETTAEAFPTIDDGVALKVALLGGTSDVDSSQVPASEAEVISTLAGSDRADVFPVDALRIEQRAKVWWTTNRDYAAVAQIAELPELTIREAFLTGVASALSVSDIHRFMAEYRPADAAMVIRREQIPAQQAYWQCPPDLQVRLAQIVAGAQDRFGNDLTTIIKAALTAHADEAAPVLSEAAASQLVPIVAEWIGQTGDIEGIGPRWRAALNAREHEVLAWLSAEESPKPWSVWLAITLFQRNIEAVHDTGVEIWLKSLKRADMLPTPQRLQVYAYFLGMGLVHPADATFPAVSATFAKAYRAAQSGELDDQAWNFVSPWLPESPRWREWDRCERLRRSIVERFVGQVWSPQLLFDLARDTDVFGDLIKEFRDTWDGRRFLRVVTRAVEDGSFSVPPECFPLID